MIRRPPRSTQSRSSAASDVYKRQDALVVKGNVEVDAGRIEDQAIVGDDGHALGLGRVGDAARGGRVDGIQHQHLRAVGQRGLGLRELLVGVLIGVAIQDRAIRAQLLELGLEERPVGRFVTGGLGFGQQQGNLAAGGAVRDRRRQADAGRGRRGGRRRHGGSRRHHGGRGHGWGGGGHNCGGSHHGRGGHLGGRRQHGGGGHGGGRRRD